MSRTPRARGCGNEASRICESVRFKWRPAGPNPAVPSEESGDLTVTEVQRRENGPDFVGFPLCGECKDHNAYECANEEDHV